jgi:transcriptional regulator with XRE-family HTH domain
MVRVNECIRQERKRQRLTQRDLADALSVSQAYVARMEHGEREVSDDMLLRIAAVLNIPPSAFRIPPPRGLARVGKRRAGTWHTDLSYGQEEA